MTRTTALRALEELRQRMEKLGADGTVPAVYVLAVLGVVSRLWEEAERPADTFRALIASSRAEAADQVFDALEMAHREGWQGTV